VLDKAVTLDAIANSYSYLPLNTMRTLHGIGYELECLDRVVQHAGTLRNADGRSGTTTRRARNAYLNRRLRLPAHIYSLPVLLLKH
jgi:hypothetical protein